ncbi:unnamed protein product [Arctogadus glacialis]
MDAAQCTVHSEGARDSQAPPPLPTNDFKKMLTNGNSMVELWPKKGSFLPAATKPGDSGVMDAAQCTVHSEGARDSQAPPPLPTNDFKKMLTNGNVNISCRFVTI